MGNILELIKNGVMPENEKEKNKDVSFKDVSPQYVLCAVIDKNNNLLLLENNNEEEKAKYDFCFGQIKDYEIPTQAVIREVIQNLTISLEEVTEMFRCINIKTPYAQMEDTQTATYVLKTTLTAEEINEKIQILLKNEKVKYKGVKSIDLNNLEKELGKDFDKIVQNELLKNSLKTLKKESINKKHSSNITELAGQIAENSEVILTDEIKNVMGRIIDISQGFPTRMLEEIIKKSQHIESLREQGFNKDGER